MRPALCSAARVCRTAQALHSCAYAGGIVGAVSDIPANNVGGGFFFAGTSILIVVGVALDFVKQLEAQLMMRNYEGFLN